MNFGAIKLVLSSQIVDFRFSGSKEAEHKIPHQRGEATLKAFFRIDKAAHFDEIYYVVIRMHNVCYI